MIDGNGDVSTKKVLVTAYRCNPNIGGEPGRSWMWVQRYLEMGYEVWCITNKWDEQDINSASYDKDRCHFEFVSTPKYLQKLYINTLGVYVHYLYWQKLAFNYAKDISDRRSINFSHHISYGSPQLGTHLWKLDIPLIYGPLGGGQFPPVQFKQYFGEGWREEVYRKYISKLLLLLNRHSRSALRHASLVMAVNYETAYLAKKYGSKRVEMFLDSGLDKNSMPAELPRRKRGDVLRILWVGRLLPRKGLPLALEALSKLHDRVKFRFTILGDGPIGATLEDSLNRYGLKDRVDWLGQVGWEVVREHYESNDVFLFCSLRESFGAQLLEAMAYGLAIIALDHQGAKVFIPEDAGIKVPVNTPNETVSAIAHAITAFHDDPELLMKANDAAYLAASKYLDENRYYHLIESYAVTSTV